LGAKTQKPAADPSIRAGLEPGLGSIAALLLTVQRIAGRRVGFNRREDQVPPFLHHGLNDGDQLLIRQSRCSDLAPQLLDSPVSSTSTASLDLTGIQLMFLKTSADLIS